MSQGQPKGSFLTPKFSSLVRALPPSPRPCPVVFVLALDFLRRKSSGLSHCPVPSLGATCEKSLKAQPHTEMQARGALASEEQ